MSKICFRNDDVGKDTDLKLFKQVHSLFIKYNVLHTVALICNGIESNKPLVKYLKYEVDKGRIDIQVHCYDHFDFCINPAQLSEDLPKSVEIITTLFGKRPTILFPPWNKSNPIVERIAGQNGLRVSNQKISLSQYLRGVRGEVINYHSWSDECKDLEAALIKYTNG